MAVPDGSVLQGRKNVTSVRAKGERIDVFDGIERERAIEVRKQGPAARGLPFQGAAKHAGIHADQQQTALTGKVPGSSLRNLCRGREVDEIVATINLGAMEYANAFGFSP
jgi:hypothetical protein